MLPYHKCETKQENFLILVFSQKFFDDDIIYENFEEFNIDSRNDKDIYINSNFFSEVDTKGNAKNKFSEKNIIFNKHNIVENNAFPQRNPKTKFRRNATHKMIMKHRSTRLLRI